MDIGLNIAEGVRVRVGDTIEKITSSMKEHNIEYVIPYKNEVGANIDMVMFMEKCGVELNIYNGIIIFIKSNNNESNYIMQLGDSMSPVEALSTIKNNLATAFNIKPSDIRIDKFDGSSLNSTLSIPISNTEKVKIELIMGAHQKVYMHSIGLAK